MAQYVTLSTFPAEDILKLVEFNNPKKFMWGKVAVKITGNRLLCFKRSPICAICGVVGTQMLIQTAPGQENFPHFNLYGWKAGRLTLMTRDHIRPVSQGGSNSLANSQTLCARCNERKGSEWDGRSGVAKMAPPLPRMPIALTVVSEVSNGGQAPQVQEASKVPPPEVGGTHSTGPSTSRASYARTFEEFLWWFNQNPGEVILYTVLIAWLINQLIRS